ncbi:MAG: DUF5590 domain-containing protein [Enterococcus sp.]
MKKRKLTRQDRILIIVAAVLLSIILFSVIFYVRATRPMRQAEAETTAIAKKYADITTVDQFYWFNREKTYFSVTGTTAKGQEAAVIVPKAGEKVTVLDLSEGFTEEEARAQITSSYAQEEVQTAKLGMYDDQPCWEVVTKTSTAELNYYLLDFKSGEEIKKVTNI